MPVPRGRGALYSKRGKRILRPSLQRARTAGREITELRTAAGKKVRGQRLTERLATIETGRRSRRRPEEPREVTEAGASGPRLVTPWTVAQARRIELWQFATTHARSSGDFTMTLERILKVRPGGRYAVYIAGPDGRQGINLESDPDRLRALNDAGMLSSSERRSYPRASIPGRAEAPNEPRSDDRTWCRPQRGVVAARAEGPLRLW
jgi:hypothetical protein